MDREKEFTEFEKLFWQISRNMGYLWKSIYEQTFPGSQSHILFVLERNGPKKMSELAETLNLTPGAVTSASDRLIENGFIARIPDENDRRVIRLDLTEKGKKTLKKLQCKGHEIMGLVFSHISDNELKMMNTIFGHASENIQQIRKDFIF